MELDREAIERRDFPVSRRGYDQGSVDAHLRTVANHVAEFAQAQAEGAHSRASSAGSQVEGIIAAAEEAAEEVLRDAHADAARARAEAVEGARAHVAEVRVAAAGLLERVRELDRALNSVLGALRSGATSVATDAQALEASISELFDAASAPRADAAGEPADADALDSVPSAPASAAMPASPLADPPPSAGGASADEPARAHSDDDVDGARLIALNMALNGDSRADTERYLAKNFQLSDRAKLIEEVFAAVEA